MSGNPSAGGSSGGGAGGTGGPGGSGGFGGGGSGPFCDFEFDTVLGTPDPAQIAMLAIGDVLYVSLADNPPAVFVATASGVPVGGVLQSATELRDCMQQGFRYQARVLEVNGGLVRVRISVL